MNKKHILKQIRQKTDTLTHDRIIVEIKSLRLGLDECNKEALGLFYCYCPMIPVSRLVLNETKPK